MRRNGKRHQHDGKLKRKVIAFIAKRLHGLHTLIDLRPESESDQLRSWRYKQCGFDVGAKWTQENIAKYFRISPSSVSEWKNGKVAVSKPAVGAKSFRKSGSGPKASVLKEDLLKQLQDFVMGRRNQKKMITTKMFKKKCVEVFGRDLSYWEYSRIKKRCGFKVVKVSNAQKIPKDFYPKALKYTRNMLEWREERIKSAGYCILVSLDETWTNFRLDEGGLFTFVGDKDKTVVSQSKNGNNSRKGNTLIPPTMVIVGMEEEPVLIKLPLKVLMKKNSVKSKARKPTLKLSFREREKLFKNGGMTIMQNGSGYVCARDWDDIIKVLLKETKSHFESYMEKEFFDWGPKFSFENVGLSYDAAPGHTDLLNESSRKKRKRERNHQPSVLEFLRKKGKEIPQKKFEKQVHVVVSKLCNNLGVKCFPLDGGMTPLLQPADIRGNDVFKKCFQQLQSIDEASLTREQFLFRVLEAWDAVPTNDLLIGWYCSGLVECSARFYKPYFVKHFEKLDFKFEEVEEVQVSGVEKEETSIDGSENSVLQSNVISRYFLPKFLLDDEEEEDKESDGEDSDENSKIVLPAKKRRKFCIEDYYISK